MTHPRRKQLGQSIAAKFPGYDLRVIVDPHPNAAPATIRTARAAWAAAPTDATHHLVLQDDIDCDAAFLDNVTVAVRRFPDRPLTFFTEWGSGTANAVRVGTLCGASWAEVVDDYVPTLALVLPASLGRGLSEHLARVDPGYPDDRAVGEFLTHEGHTALISVPNLVEHRDVPSLAANGFMGPRRSPCYAPEHFVPTATTVMRLPEVPHLPWWNARADLLRPDSRPPAFWHRDVLSIDLHPDDPVARRRSEAIRTLGREAALLDDHLLASLWTVAHGLGVLAARQSSGAETSTPLAQQALRTLAPGALRRFIHVERGLAVYERLTRFVTDAVRHGIRNATTSANTPPERSPTV